MTENNVSILIALLGLGCFLWPVVQRLRGAAPESVESRAGLRSPLWWAGFVLTAVALYIQRGGQ